MENKEEENKLWQMKFAQTIFKTSKKSFPLPVTEVSSYEKQIFFTAGIVGMLSGVALDSTDGAEVDCERGRNPYVTSGGG